MKFIGILKEFSLKNEEQYNTIGDFWDELSVIYGMENLQGLGYKWENNTIYYAIGLKKGIIENSNFTVELPDYDWTEVNGETDNLKEIYDEIYKNGKLKYEIETFTEDGKCKIKYYR